MMKDDETRGRKSAAVKLGGGKAREVRGRGWEERMNIQMIKEVQS